MFLKSQAAMEFLMTYGWAILVVLISITALAYFGVLSPEKFIRERCIIPGLTCVSHKVESNQITMFVVNNLGRTITVDSVDVGGCSDTFSTTMTSGNEFSFVITGCNNGAQKEKFKGDITIGYTEKRTGLTKTISGNVVAKIE